MCSGLERRLEALGQKTAQMGLERRADSEAFKRVEGRLGDLGAEHNEFSSEARINLEQRLQQIAERRDEVTTKTLRQMQVQDCARLRLVI